MHGESGQSETSMMGDVKYFRFFIFLSGLGTFLQKILQGKSGREEGKNDRRRIQSSILQTYLLFGEFFFFFPSDEEVNRGR